MPKVILTGVAEKDGNQFTAICPELDVASCGDSVEEALDMLEEALEVYLEAVHDVGELAREFEEMGIEVHPDDLKSDGVAASSMQGKKLAGICCKFLIWWWLRLLSWHEFLSVPADN